MGINLLNGRDFRPTDTLNSGRVAIVNEEFVRLFFPNENPLLQLIMVEHKQHQIVGVCSNHNCQHLRYDISPTLYMPYAQNKKFSMNCMIRSVLPPMSLIPSVRKVIADIDRNLPIEGITTQKLLLKKTLRFERLLASLSGSLAFLGLALSCIGLYGIMAYNVARRTGEMGIRKALGARPWDVARPILREALTLAAIGVAIGLPVALALVRVIRSLFYGIEPHVWQDIRYGFRMLKRNPGFTTVAVLTLALGIGANTAIFTMINTLLLRSLPVKDPQQLVLVTDGGNASLGYPLYEQFRDGNQSFSGLFAADGISKRSMTVTDASGAEAAPVWARAVSGNFFSVLGVPAAAGRTLTPNDDSAGDPQAVAVISHGFWQRRFGMDPTVIGKKIVLDEVPFAIVGVTPPGFFGFEVGRNTDMWWPIQMYPQVDTWQDALTSTGSWWLRVMGRLKAGAPKEQACAELDVMFKQFLAEQAEKWGTSDADWQRFYASRRIELQAGGTGYTRLRGQFRQPLLILMAIVALVLLVACANLAGLLLARGAARRREFSMRAALGAGRFTLVRQLVTESLLLAAAGGMLGLLLAQLGVRLLAGYIPGYGETVLLNLKPDLRILVFALGVSAFTGILFGLFPAWRVTRLDVVTALKEQAGNVMGRESGQLWNKALVVSQIALSCCLLIGTGLFVRTVQKLKALDVGLNRENLLTFQLNLGKGYDISQRGDFYWEVLRCVEGLPGVRSACCSNIQSLGGSESGWGPNKVVPQDSGTNVDEGLDVRGTAVTVNYFSTMGIPLLRGRDFGPQDEPTAPVGQMDQTLRPVIIDETIARKLFSEENPVGRFLRADGSGPPLEVIGVAKDVIHKRLRGGPRPSVYSLPAPNRRYVLSFFHTKTVGNPLTVAGGIRRIVRELDPKVEVTGLHTMKDLVDAQLLQERTISQLASFFSLSALVLACLGLYGTLSYGVIRRTREIGVRMALGAQTRDVLSVVVRQGMTLTLVGCVLGVILAVALTRVVSSLLYGVTATDPITFAGAWLVLMIVALLACYIPARRAAKVDPMVALRYE
jgi:predicted permease